MLSHVKVCPKPMKLSLLVDQLRTASVAVNVCLKQAKRLRLVDMRVAAMSEMAVRLKALELLPVDRVVTALYVASATSSATWRASVAGGQSTYT